MWQRFTEASRRVVYYSQLEAQSEGVTQVTPEHLLLGLLREPASLSYRVATRCGADTEAIVAALRKPAVPRNPSSDYAAVATDMSLLSRAKKAIDLSYDEARNRNSDTIETVHLLLGVLREGGNAAQILQNNGVTLDAARRFAQEITDETASGEAA